MTASTRTSTITCLAIVFTLTGIFTAPTQAGPGKPHAHEATVGSPGDLNEVSRTVEVVMADNYYEPEQIEVGGGETVRFVVRNEGSIVHEFNIGTPELHKQHQPEMQMMFEHGVLEIDKIHHDRMKMDMGNGHTMDHSEPNSVLLEPGDTAEVVWKFSGNGKLEFACNMPGHYESGMVGEIAMKR